MSKKQRSVSGTGTREFQPAILFGGPTIDELELQYFLSLQNESYDDQGLPRLHASAFTDDPSLSAVCRLSAEEPGLRPTIRPVEVRGKSDYVSYAAVYADDAPGMAVLMTRTENDMMYFNCRFLPYSKLSDIVVGTSSGGVLTLSIPDENVIKLNLTLAASPAGEMLYKTHKTEVILPNLSEEDDANILQKLESNAASVISHLIGQVYKTDVSPAVMLGRKAANSDAALQNNFGWPPDPQNLKGFCLLLAYSGGMLGMAGLTALARGRFRSTIPLGWWMASSMGIFTYYKAPKFGDAYGRIYGQSDTFDGFPPGMIDDEFKDMFKRPPRP